MRTPRLVLVFSVFMFAATSVSKTEECISSPTSSVSDSILNNLNSTSCLTLRSKQEVVSPEVITLYINRSCVNGSDVEIMALVSGFYECSEMKFLFARRKGADCMKKKLCQATRMKDFGHKRTLCLLQCKKNEEDDLHYGLGLINGLQESYMELCGLKLYQDHCAQNPCGSNEICDDNIDSYNCKCKPNFTGINCETKIDHCDGDPCKNYATCQDGINTFSCKCTAGFTGDNCETDVNDCDGDICMNGGSCEDGINSYSCECKEGFSGARCEINVDDCDGVICQNGGACQDGIKSFSCLCACGFTGARCETNVDDCDGVICQNGGTCQDVINNYICNCPCEFSGRHCETRLINVDWIPPSGWDGPNHVLYRSFDNTYCLVLMEETKLANYEALLPGKKNTSASTDRTKNQWIDLGIHTEACMTQPETCGVAGGAITMWLKVNECPQRTGIFTTTQYEKSTGSFILCKDDKFGYGIHISQGRFCTGANKTGDWFHVVLNFIGPSDGVRIYHDTVEVKRDKSKTAGNFTHGDRRIVIGRRFSGSDKRYASVQVDELLFFNQKLTETEIIMLMTSQAGSSELIEQTTSFVITEGMSPSGWTGPDAVLYQTFDSSDGLVLMEGTQQMGPISLVSGKVNSASTLDHTKRQWIDLGIHTDACMTRPETCGAAGGAVSMWMKLMECPPLGGIISSLAYLAAGSLMYCNDGSLLFRVDLPEIKFLTSHSIPSGWIHIVLNYIGSNDGEGIRIYYNGAEVGSDTDKSEGPNSAGDGRIVIGRGYTNRDQNYASVQVDELIYFNAALTTDDVQFIYNSA